eukprot:GEMP01023310.1.p1 GENE.GEMP01023310.1~~GEMP01023310.1.p1  ORF type:complete len:536 (+),score=130.96 GEMP01023310.1:102-1709(+)
MERLVELFEATMDEDPTGDLGFQQLEGICTQQNMDLGATFCTIAMALEKKHPIPSEVAYSKVLKAVNIKLKLMGKRPSMQKQAQWEKCVVLQQLGKICVIQERAADAIKHLKQSLEIPTRAPPEKILDVMNFTGTSNHFLSTTHKMIARAYICQARKHECDPALIEAHLKLSEQVLKEDSRPAQNDNDTRWQSLPVQRHFGYSFSDTGEQVEVYLQTSVTSKDEVRVTQPDATALDARWQKSGTEYWFHLCPMEPTVVEDTTYRVSKAGKLTIALYFATKRLVRSKLVGSQGTCGHLQSVKQPLPTEHWPENTAPQPPEQTAKTPQKWTPQTTPCAPVAPETSPPASRTTATHSSTASTTHPSVQKPPTPPHRVTRRSHGTTVAPLDWDDNDTAAAPSLSQPNEKFVKATCAQRVVSATVDGTSTLERASPLVGKDAPTAVEQKAEAVDVEETATVTGNTVDGNTSVDEVIRDGDTLIVRFPAEPGVNLDLKSDVLRVSGQSGAYRDISLGCCVDVNQCRAKKRRGMIEVRLSVM